MEIYDDKNFEVEFSDEKGFTIALLESKLKELNIPRDMYNIVGGFPNESYCISQNNNKWEVYYSERGNKTGLKIFKTEQEACEYFLEIMQK